MAFVGILLLTPLWLYWIIRIVWSVPSPVVPYDIQRFQPMDSATITFTWEQVRVRALTEHGSIWTIPDDNTAAKQDSHQETVHTLDALKKAGTVCQVFCRFPQPTFELEHFPHFLQQAYPCWSLLQRFVAGSSFSSGVTHPYFYIILPTKLSRKLAYIQAVLRVMEKSPLRIRLLYGNESLPVQDCDADINQEKETQGPRAVLVEKNYSDSGWDRPTRYIMSEDYENDVALWQQVVLDEFYRGIPSAYNAPIMNVLILDRKQSSRSLHYATAMKRQLEATSLDGIGPISPIKTRVKHITSFSGYSLQEQARFMHEADLILSPHGAQLSNLIYIRPCTVVVEFFPRSYYLQFFPSLVLVSRGLSYEAYPRDGDPHQDTQVLLQSDDPDAKGQARSGPIYASSEEVVEAYPRLVQAAWQCRKEWKDSRR